MATAALNIYSNRNAALLSFQRRVRSGRLARLVANRRLVSALYWSAVTVLALAFAAVVLLHGVQLLKSSGVIPTTGAISGLATFVTNIMDSVKWFAATMVGVSLAVIAAMFMMGHQSAHSHGMRVGFGVIALVCLPGVIA